MQQLIVIFFFFSLNDFVFLIFIENSLKLDFDLIVLYVIKCFFVDQKLTVSMHTLLLEKNLILTVAKSEILFLAAF